MGRAALPPIRIIGGLADEPGAAERRILAAVDPRTGVVAGEGPATIALLTDPALADPRRSAATRAALDRLDRAGDGSMVRLVPPPRFGLVGRAVGGRGAVPVDLRERGGRFDEVRMPAPIVAADARWLVTSLPGPGIGRGSRPIWAVAAYAGAREAVVARLARTAVEPGVIADLAAAALPALVLLSGRLAGHHLAVTTPDLIAAELVWLALAGGDAAGDDPIGPWEDATVQRATEIGLGARLPSQLEPTLLPGGGDDEGERSALSDLAERLRLRLGIPAAAER